MQINIFPKQAPSSGGFRNEIDNSQTKQPSMEPASGDGFHTTLRNINTNPKTPPQPKKGPVSHQTSFFDLPREIRDMVYDYYWLANPGLRASSTPFHRLVLQLRYHGQYEIPIGATGYEKPDDIGEHYPTWLLANKQLLTEAVHQFASKAAWFWGDAPLEKKPGHFRPSSILDASQIHSMILYVGSLDDTQNLETPWDRSQMFAEALNLGQTHGAGIRRLRLVGSSYSLPHDGDFGKRGLFIARMMVRIFSAVDVQTLELDICNKWVDRRRILYELVGRGADVSLIVKKDEKRGFPLRCNVARPNGRGYWPQVRRRNDNETE